MEGPVQRRIAGIDSHPRIVDVCDRSTPSWSMSHSGKRARISSSATRPSEPGERGTQTEVEPETERQVLAEVAADVEPVGIGVSPLIAVGRSDEEEHRTPGRHGHPVVVDVAGDVAGEMRPGRFVAQRLLDRVGDE